MVDGIFTQTIHIAAGQPRNAEPIEQNLNQLFSNTSLLNNAIDAVTDQVSGGTLSATNIIEFVAGRGVAVDNVAMMDGKARLISIRAQITGSNNGSAIFTTSTTHGLSTAEPIKFAAAPGSNIDGGFSGSVTYYARALTTTTFSAHLTAANATANVSPVAVTTASTGTRFLIASPLNAQEGQIWTDGNGSGVHAFLGGQIVDIATEDVYSLLTRFSGTKTPTYVSATQFTVNRIANRDSGGNFTMLKSSSTTVDITTTGLNGIAQSGNLSGTISVTSGSDAITFSVSQASLIIGDVVVTAGGQARKLISGSGISWTAESQFQTTETAVPFKRGGRASFYTANTSGAVGTVHYYLYVISDGATVGLILSTRDVAKGDTLVDLPSGYLYSQILPFAVTLYNISTAAGVYIGNIAPFYVGSGWPYRARVEYDNFPFTDGITGLTYGTTCVLQAGAATSFTAVDLSMWIPSFSKRALLITSGNNGPAYRIRATGQTHNGWTTSIFNGNSSGIYQEASTDSNQSIDYVKASGTGASVNIDVLGYEVTGIF